MTLEFDGSENGSADGAPRHEETQGKVLKLLKTITRKRYGEMGWFIFNLPLLLGLVTDLGFLILNIYPNILALNLDSHTSFKFSFYSFNFQLFFV